MNPSNAAAPHYAAFISYRHLSPDMEIANKLHWLLEHNPVRPHRGYSRRIRPVFIDKAELPITADLGEGLKLALRNSDCLFVVCSPQLKRSPYCMQEIRYFKELHNGRLDRIFTILVDGEPGDAFPEELRFEVRRCLDENGHESEEQVAIEPLYADVRAKTIRESLKILRKREYLRLAAGFFRCSYDELYRRRRRWLVRMSVITAVTVLAIASGFTWYARYRAVEFARAKAETYAAYTEGRVTGEDEILAMTLGLEAYGAAQLCGSTRLDTALRSAAVQYLYKMEALPIAPVMTAHYENSDGTVRYLGAGERHMLIADVNECVSVFDAKTGMRLTDYIFDRIFVAKEDHSHLVSVGARTGQDGITRDYYAVFSMPEDQKLGEYAFRESSTAVPAYSLNYVAGLNCLMDGDQAVAFFDDQGRNIDRGSVPAYAAAISEPKKETVPFTVTLKRDVLSKSNAVVDAQGKTVLRLPGANGATAFSFDYAYFAFENDGRVSVYRTDTWQELASFPISGKPVWQIGLYNEPGFLSVTSSMDNKNITAMYDWNTGSILLTFEGYPLASREDHCLFVVQNGVLTRYHYEADALAPQADVMKQYNDLCLVSNGRFVSLLDAKEGKTLLRAECAMPELVRYSGNLERVLIPQEGNVICYTAGGAKLWETGAPARALSLSGNGGRAAVLDETGTIRVINGVDGSGLYTLAPDMYGEMDVSAIEVSGDGLLLLGGNDSLWFPDGGGNGASLGEFTLGQATKDSLLILSNPGAYAKDFAVFSARDGSRLYTPEGNTGAYAYSPASGCLVRQNEASGGFPTYTVEVLRRKGSAFEKAGALTLPDTDVNLYLDQTGRYLTIKAGGRAQVYDLQSLTCLLDVNGCNLRYENGRLYAGFAAGESIFHCELLEGEELRSYALQAITSPLKQRTLSEDERKMYSFSE